MVRPLASEKAPPALSAVPRRVHAGPAMASELTPEYIEMLRKLDGVQKLRTAGAMYWSARELKAAGLRSLHPDWSEEQVQRKVKEIFMYARD